MGSPVLADPTTAGGGPASAALDRGSPMPLWAQLRDRLTRQLDAGEFADSFPSEARLAAQYQVSRQTVRAALRELRAGGRLIAERGRGGRVADDNEIQAPLGALYSLFRAVEAAGHEARSEVRALDRRRDPVAAARLGLSAGAALVYLERLRLADREPLALDQLWMPAELAEPLLGLDFTGAAFYDELAAHCGLRLTRGGELIRAAVPTPAQRRLLGLGRTTAALRIERLATWRDRAVEWRVTLVRGDRFGLSAEWSPEQDYRLAAVPEPVAGPR